MSLVLLYSSITTSTILVVTMHSASVSCASVGGQLPGSRLRALAPPRHWPAPAPAQTQETPRSEVEKLHTSIDKYGSSIGKINDNYLYYTRDIYA